MACPGSRHPRRESFSIVAELNDKGMREQAKACVRNRSGLVSGVFWATRERLANPSVCDAG